MPQHGNKADIFEEHFGYLLHDVARLLRREFDRQIKSLGLTRAQWTALAALLRNDGLTQTELAFLLDMGRAPLGTLIDRLERDGWVSRKPDPEDRRANRVYITKKIKPLLPRLQELGEQVHNAAVSEIPADEIAHIIRTLSRIKGNLLALHED